MYTPNGFKRGFAKKNRFTILESFHEALWSSRVHASLKVLISSVHSAVTNSIS